jgi:hypothetical protein
MLRRRPPDGSVAGGRIDINGRVEDRAAGGPPLLALALRRASAGPAGRPAGGQPGHVVPAGLVLTLTGLAVRGMAR